MQTSMQESKTSDQSEISEDSSMQQVMDFRKEDHHVKMYRDQKNKQEEKRKKPKV